MSDKRKMYIKQCNKTYKLPICEKYTGIEILISTLDNNALNASSTIVIGEVICFTM